MTIPSDGVPVNKCSGLFGSEPPSRATLWRWILNGVINPNGERVKLGSFLIGKRRFVTPAAVEEFIAACNSPLPADSKSRQGITALLSDLGSERGPPASTHVHIPADERWESPGEGNRSRAAEAGDALESLGA